MLGLCDEEVNQRDEMVYRGLRSEDTSAKRNPFPPEMHRRDTLRLPLPPDYPPCRLKLTGEMLPDFWRIGDGSLVVSARLREALQLSPAVAQTAPIVLDSDDPRAHAKGYMLVRVLAGVACMDRGRSDVEVKTVIHRPTGQPVESVFVRRFVLDPATAPPADLFRSEEHHRTLIATEALAARVQAGGFSGIAFGHPWDLDRWGKPRTRRAPDGTRVPYREEPFGALPVRDLARRPPFVPDPALPEALRPIEAAIRHRLPEHYVRFLLNPPAELLRLYARRYDLVTSPDRVTELNRNVRHVKDCPFLRGGDDGWPEDWLVIGWDGCGNNFALDLGDPSPPVLFWDHEMAVASVRSPGVAEFAAELIEHATEDDIREDDDF